MDSARSDSGGKPVAFSPIVTRTQTICALAAPIAFNCVKFIVVRDGSATLFSEHGNLRVSVGDVVVLDENTRCGAEPDGQFTATTLYLDRDYIIDHVFWQYSAVFSHRNDASRFLETQYPVPTMLARIGADQTAHLSPLLDELTVLSLEAGAPRQFYRTQSLVSAVLDIVIPQLARASTHIGFNMRGAALPSLPRHRQFEPIRDEVRVAASMLREDLGQRWTLTLLARYMHLSPSQVRRLFIDAFGKSPIAYLTMLRVERMAEMLRVSEESISVLAGKVGWNDPDFAARQFRRSMGLSPSAYRRISRDAK